MTGVIGLAIPVWMKLRLRREDELSILRREQREDIKELRESVAVLSRENAHQASQIAVLNQERTDDREDARRFRDDMRVSIAEVRAMMEKVNEIETLKHEVHQALNKFDSLLNIRIGGPEIKSLIEEGKK